MSQVLQVPNGDYLIKVKDGGTITLDTGSGAGRVDITGNLNVAGDIRFGGSINIGDSPTDIVSILGSIDTDLKPDVGGVRNLGSPTKYWGTLYASRIENPIAGNVTIKNVVDPQEGKDAANKDYVDAALGKVDNVFYVSVSGDDLNDGKTLGKAKRTIKAAIEAAKLELNQGYDTTIFVKSGDYTEDNPLRLPAKLSIYGDGLRATTVRPLNKTQDLFWVTNGNYIANITMKDHEFPAAAVAFPPPTEEYPAVSIFQSPYVQNCTSITTTGCGMRVDGDYVKGLKSMVLDAYTQYNQGGIGIHMLNRGNTQLVSAFTINCDIAILCTNGGFCSLTNSNASFGNFGLVSDGVSPPLYSATLLGDKRTGVFGDELVLKGLVNKPNVGDAVSFNGSTNFYTVTSASDLRAGDMEITGPDFSSQPSDRRFVRQVALAGKEKVQIDTIDFINETYKGLDYNQFKCSRDTGLIIDAVLDDMVFGTNYKSIQAGLSYRRQSASVVINDQLVETVSAINFAKEQILELVSQDSSIGNPEYVTIDNNFNLLVNILQNGPSAVPSYNWTPPVGADPAKSNAVEIIQTNRDFLIEEGIAYIESNFQFTYDKATCQRDIGLVIDAIGYDLMFGSNFRTITAGRAYYRGVISAQTVITAQKIATVDAFTYLKDLLLDIVQGNETAFQDVSDLMDLLLNIFEEGLSAVPEYEIPDPTGYDVDYKNARDLIEANREFIKSEVVEYIADQNPTLGFLYNKELCQRDVGLIIDAVGYDLMFGSNFRSISAGRAYTRANASVVTSTQKTATLDAFGYLKNLLINAVNDDPTAVASVSANMDIIIDIIDTGLLGVPSYVIPSPTGYDVGYQNARDLVDANRDFISAEVIKYIEVNYPAVYASFDQVACERDISYILDAVYYDLTYGGNLESIVAARAYYSGAVLQLGAGEKAATIAAYDYMGTIIESIAQNISITPLQLVEPQVTGTAGSLAAAQEANALVEIIKTTIDTEVVPSEVAPSTAWVDEILVAQYNVLQFEKEFIKQDVTNYIDATYPPGYDVAACRRDMDLILDAVFYDMTYGGNMETLIAGRAYYTNGNIVNPDEKDITLDAYAFMKSLIEDIAQDIAVTPIQVLEQQVGGTGGSLAAAEAAGQLIEDIRTIIADISEPTVTLADTSWVSPAFLAFHETMQDEKDNKAAAVTNYIDAKYFILNYDRGTCQRDIELIIDAIISDMMYGSNFRSITAGRAYYREGAALVTGLQRTATLDAFNKLKSLLAALVSTNPTALSRVNSSMDIIIDILGDGLSVVPEYVIPEPTGYDSGYRNARDLIDSNRTFIKAEVVEFINQNFVIPDGFTYDIDACLRDMDLILDAIFYDMTYQGNLETLIAGKAYYSYGVSVNPDEKEETLAAYEYMKDIVLLIAENQAVTPLQVSVTQTFGDAGSEEAAIFAGELVEVVRTAVRTREAPAEIQPDNGWVEPELVVLAVRLNSNKETVKEAVTDFIDKNYTTNRVPFVYDQDKCKRDVGFIVDALGYDLMFGSNFRSITAGRAYYRANASVVTDLQKEATIKAYEHLRGVVSELVEDSAAAVASVTDNMNLILDIFDQGLTAVPDYVIPEPTGYDSNFRNTRNSIEANRNFVKAEVIAYINDNYVVPNGFTYNVDSCLRDVDYILDAIYYDLTYGGDLETTVAANSYYVGTQLVNPGEKAATLDTYSFMKDLLIDISNNVTVVPLQGTVSQVAGTPGNLASATAVGNLVEKIRTVIDTGTLATPVAPSLAWVSTILEDQFDILQTEKENIKISVADFIDAKYFLLTYDRAKCRRDVGYIIDALADDVMLGSNFRSIVAARSYYRATASTVLTSQKSATIGALRRIKELASITSGGDAESATRINDRMELMVDILNRGPSAIPAYVIPNPTSGFTSAYSNARTQIDVNREFIKAEVFAWIEANKPVGFVYDQTQCERDLDYILDAIYFDITYATNVESIVAGRAYYVGTSIVNPGEEALTIGAYEYMRDIMIDIAQNIPLASPLQIVVTQDNSNPPGSLAAAEDIGDLVQVVIDYITDPEAVIVVDPPNTSWPAVALVATRDNLLSSKESIKTLVTQFIDGKYSYDQSFCRRDIGYILDAVTYDILYGGNSQTTTAADEYYSGETLRIGEREVLMTLNTFKYLKTIVGACLLNIPVTPLQTILTQDTTLPPASADEVIHSNQLFMATAEIIGNGYTSTVLLNETIPDFDPVPVPSTVTFHQYSLITASGQTFEWVGAGTSVNTSLPYLGGVPISENKAVETNGGKVYWTGTDQFGDFNIGGELVIRRDTGTIEGRTFTKSLFAVLTPYILAVGE